MNKIEENIYQHKCCQCGNLFFMKGKVRVTCQDCIIFNDQQRKHAEDIAATDYGVGSLH